MTLNRRRSISLAAFLASGPLIAGCRGRIRRFDPPPDRHLLEDRWSGYRFKNLIAEYALPLDSPSPSLSRSVDSDIPVFTSDGKQVSAVTSSSTVRPSIAMVEMQFSEDSPSESKIEVVVRWPKLSAKTANRTQYREETFVASIGFDEAHDFINGTGRFRCDPDECYYGDADSRSDVTALPKRVSVTFEISGPNSASNRSLQIDYEEQELLWKYARKACPGIS